MEHQLRVNPAGDLSVELEEWEKLLGETAEMDAANTYTGGCSSFLTILCC